MTAASAHPGPMLVKLGDTDQTIPNPDEDIRGREVLDANSESLGKVADLLVDSDAQQVRFLFVEHGGIFGIGAKGSYLPVEAITGFDADTVHVNTDARTVAGAPPYDPDISAEPQYYEDVYGYYGYAPYWAPGATAAGFPYFGRGR